MLSKKYIVMGLSVIVLGILAREYFIRKSALNTLKAAYQITDDCRTSEAAKYPIAWQDNLQVSPENLETYRECQQNTIKHAKFQEIDITKINVEILCRCRSVFLNQMKKEYKVDSDEYRNSPDCHVFQATDSIEQQCRVIANRK
jgi:hypothetical protein